MKASQIPFYAACPILYWPWLWLQFYRLDRWVAQRVAAGEPCGAVLNMSARGTLTIAYLSDNLRDDIAPSYATLTFEDLTAIYYPDWMYSVVHTLASPRAMGEASTRFTNATEIADALIPVP